MTLQVRFLQDLCLSSIERVNPALNPDNEFWYVDISSIDNVAKTISTPTQTKGKYAPVRARQVIRAGDVLVSTTRPNLNAVALVPSEYDGQICSTGFCVLRCGEELDSGYLFHFVRSCFFINSLSSLVQGALYPAVTDKQVFAQSIPWVPIEKQCQIAARLKVQLAEVDKALQAAEAQARDAATLKKKILNVFLGNIQDYVPIGSIAKVQSGYAFKSESFKPSGVRLLRNANILPGKVYWDETVCLNEDDANNYPAYKLNDGDVLISLDRPLISSGLKAARVKMSDLPALLVQRVGRFQLDTEKIDSRYLYAFLQTDMFISAISGHDQSLGVPHISPSQVESVLIPLPSIDEQRNLCLKLDKISCSARSVHTATKSQIRDLSILRQKILAQGFEI